MARELLEGARLHRETIRWYLEMYADENREGWQRTREQLERMRREGIAVEINLRSNALLLGVTGDEHPLLDYLDAGVPVVLSTDDPGLMGTGLREQFVLAAGYEQICYRDLKQIIRNSIEYSFLEDGERERLAKRLERELADFESSLTRPDR